MRLKFFYFFLLASFILNSQQRKLIKGKLLYRNNNVIAANVINNTEQYNTITDSEGEFEVNVKKGDEIIFSSVEFKIKSIVITGNENSTLYKKATYHLNAAVESEACPLNLAPTCSTSVTMALGDALASICAIEKGFKENDFARFHPSGNLHKMNFEIVDNIMNTQYLPICDKNTTIKNLILEISKGQQGAVFICENKKLLWVFTDGDLRRCIESGIRLTTKIKNIKYSIPLTIKSGSKVSMALKKMQSNKISILPVVDTMGILLGSVKLSQCI